MSDSGTAGARSEENAKLHERLSEVFPDKPMSVQEAVSKLSGFGLHDSGKRQEFQTGSRRDTADGKPVLDNISPLFLLRLASHLTLGALKYGKLNYARGQPSARYRESLGRHLIEADLGLTNEDHLAAAAFNLMCLIHNSEMKKMGKLPPELDDWPPDWVGLGDGSAPPMKPETRSKEEIAAQIAAAAAAATTYWETLRTMLKK